MKNVLVLGALGGMGKATTNRLIFDGFNVFGLDIKPNSDIEGLNYYQCDIRDEKSIISAFDIISQKIDNLFAIVSVVGIYYMDSLLEVSDKDLKNVIDINVLGIQRAIKIFYPLLNKGSKILITSSEVASLDPLPFNGIYSMSKSLLEKYAFSLRMELNLFGIKVSILRPGAVETTLLGDSMSSLEKMCEKTVIHKDTSKKFKKIVNSVESKAICADKIGKKINKIINKRNPKYIYRINNNFLLKILNALPDKLQVKIITKLLKSK